MLNVPAAVQRIPDDKIEETLPKGDVFLMRRIFTAPMQPEEITRWSREFLLQAIARHGAYYSGPLRGGARTCMALPTSEGGCWFVMMPTVPQPIVQEPEIDASKL